MRYKIKDIASSTNNSTQNIQKTTQYPGTFRESISSTRSAHIGNLFKGGIPKIKFQASNKDKQKVARFLSPREEERP